MPVHSTLSNQGDDGPGRLKTAANLAFYMYLYSLQTKPILTKALTSGVVAGLSDLISQEIRNIKHKGKKSYSFQSAAACGTFGLLVGPLYHHWYKVLDYLVGPKARFPNVKKTLLDRLLMAPIVMLLYFTIVPFLSGRSMNQIKTGIRETYWKTLLLSWRYWSVIQYFIMGYVPDKYRVLVGNGIALVWNVYLASIRQRASNKP